MAEINRGVAPPDTDTPVGAVRVGVGDTDWSELDPPELGYGNYALFSDAELELFLTLSDGNVPRAIAMAYIKLAASWNSSSATIRTDDLQYSVKDSVGSWLSLADYWNNIADNEDDRAANDIFDMVDIGTTRRRIRPPEDSSWPVCHCIGACDHW